jgi:hypothetical protein
VIFLHKKIEFSVFTAVLRFAIMIFSEVYKKDTENVRKHALGICTILLFVIAMTITAASGATALTATLSTRIGIGTADTFLSALFSLNNVSNSTTDNERDHCNNYEIYGPHKSSFNS